MELENGPHCFTGEGGILLVPSQQMQRITHWVNPNTKQMQSRWLFLDVAINERYSLDDLFTFPLLLPEEAWVPANQALNDILEEKSLCQQYAAIYRLLDQLVRLGTEKEQLDETVSSVLSYIHTHYSEKLTAETLMKLSHLSRSTFDRRFQKAVGRPVGEYINSFRLSQAALLLERTRYSLSQIAEKVGISDQFYFSKLFKRKFGISPYLFRKNSAGQQQ